MDAYDITASTANRPFFTSQIKSQSLAEKTYIARTIPIACSPNIKALVLKYRLKIPEEII